MNPTKFGKIKVGQTFFTKPSEDNLNFKYIKIDGSTGFNGQVSAFEKKTPIFVKKVT